MKNIFKHFIPILLLTVTVMIFCPATAFAAYDSKDPDSTAQYYLEANKSLIRHDLNLPESSELTLSDKAPAKVMGNLRTINKLYSKFAPNFTAIPGNDNAYVYYIKSDDEIIGILSIKQTTSDHWMLIGYTTDKTDISRILDSVETLQSLVGDQPLAYLIKSDSGRFVTPYTSEMINGYFYEGGKVYKTRDYLDAICKNVENYEKWLAEGKTLLFGGNILAVFSGYTPVETRDFAYENQWKVQLGILIGAVVIIIAAVVFAVIFIKKRAKSAK